MRTYLPSSISGEQLSFEVRGACQLWLPCASLRGLRLRSVHARRCFILITVDVSRGHTTTNSRRLQALVRMLVPCHEIATVTVVFDVGAVSHHGARGRAIVSLRCRTHVSVVPQHGIL